MKIIGVTGSSGSGKSTFSKILGEREDIKVINADQVAKELSVPGTEYLKAIENKFGNEILLEDGNLNRKLLANKIYSDNKSRENLNSLTFNYVKEEILNIIKKTESDKIKIIVIDAPLLIESNLNKICDYVIAIIADKNIKIERICKRDNIDYKTAENRLNIQPKDFYYKQNSDFIIENNKSTDLRKEVKKILEKI